MNLRTKNRLKLHRLWDEQPATMQFGTFVDDGNGDNANGGGEGKPDGGDGKPADEGKGGDGGKGGAGDGKGGDGKPSITDAEAKLLKEAMEYKDKAKKAADELEGMRKQLKEFEGIDPAKVRTLLANIEDEERKKAEARGEYDRLIKQMGERHAEEVKRVQSELEAERNGKNSLQSQIAELTVGTAFSGSAFVRDELTLTASKARVIYGAHFEFKDGNVVAYDKPSGASDRTPLVDSSGKPLGFDAALKQIIEADPDKDHLIRSKAKPGAGSGTDKSKKGGASTEKPVLSSVEKIAKGLKALANN